MTISFVHVLIVLLIGIALIVLLTAKFRIHAFFALLIACFVVGLGAQLSVPEVITSVKEGFGNIMKSLGVIIVLGTTLGVVLEHTGSTAVMANYILKKVPRRYAPLAMGITGFIVGLPIFCDSGYIVLSGLNKTLARRTNIPVVIMSVSLASGLYSVHCLIPPHPGATAAASVMAVDFGRLILFGALVAIPAMFVGSLWATYAGKKFLNPSDVLHPAEVVPDPTMQPSVINSFLPIVVPIALIAAKSFILIEANALTQTGWQKAISSLGDPIVALSVGVLLAFNSGRMWRKDTISKLLQDAVEKAGGILVIIGAGGAFGAVLQATKIGDQFNNTLPLAGMGILFPFLLTSILKTSLGSHIDFGEL